MDKKVTNEATAKPMEYSQDGRSMVPMSNDAAEVNHKPAQKKKQ